MMLRHNQGNKNKINPCSRFTQIRNLGLCWDRNCSTNRRPILILKLSAYYSDLNFKVELFLLNGSKEQNPGSWRNRVHRKIHS